MSLTDMACQSGRDLLHTAVTLADTANIAAYEDHVSSCAQCRREGN